MAEKGKIAEKDDVEKEDEEVERLVRKSPKKKPPRHDKERGRVEVDDPDVDGDDPDMSMNYKDIGGSVVVAKYVATEYLRVVKAADNDKAFENFVRKQNEGQGFKNPKQDAKKEYVKFDSLPSERQKQVRKQWKKQEDEKGKDKDKGKDEGKKKKPKKKPKTKEEKKKEKERAKREKKERQKAKKIENLEDADEADLVENALHSEDEDIQRAALDEIKRRKGPLPTSNGFPEPSSYGGSLGSEARSQIRKHIQNWDQLDYQLNMGQLQQEMLEADMDNNEKAKKFYEDVQEAYGEVVDEEIDTGGLIETNSPDALYKDAEGLREEFTEEDAADLKEKKRDWHQKAMFTPLNKVGDLAKKVEDRLQNVRKKPKKPKHLETPDDPNAVMREKNEGGGDDEDSAGDAVIEGSKEHEYLKALKESFTEVRDRKMFSKGSSSSDFLLSMQESEDLSIDPPGDYDMTDPDEQERFVESLKTLEDQELAEFVKDNPSYQAYLGLGDDYDPENVSISEEDHEAFLDAVGRDLAVRGWYEQTRENKEGDSVMSDATRLAYRERVMENFGGDNEKLKGFWDSFMGWMDDMAYEELHGENAIKSHVKASAYRNGVSDALGTLRTKKARSQTRYAPTDGYRHWRLPSSTHDLDLDDYMEIIRTAKQWLDGSFLRHVSVDWDYHMACELALDYAVYTASDYRYNGAVGMPTYEKLLAVLKRVHKPS